jgi:osmotically inducible protein OsmC
VKPAVRPLLRCSSDSPERVARAASEMNFSFSLLIDSGQDVAFSMAFAMLPGKAGFTPEKIETRATVHVDKQNGGYKITRIKLDTQARVPGIGEEEFNEQAQPAKVNCPVSQALARVEIALQTQLNS